MEIRKAAFEFCKALASMPARSDVATAISSTSNSLLHYLGHGLRAQAYGLLLIHQKKAKLPQEPAELVIQPLTEKQLATIAGFHNELLALNARCLEPLFSFSARFNIEVLSPYNRLDKLEPFHDIPKLEIFPEDGVKVLISAFNQHPLIQVAMDTLLVVDPTFSSEHYIRSLHDLEKQIKESGPLKVPEKLRAICDREPSKSAARLMYRHLGSLIGLRGSLSVLNQLIYSKIFADKLSH